MLVVTGVLPRAVRLVLIFTIYPQRFLLKFWDVDDNIRKMNRAGQALAELGFVIVTLDDTGTPLRSKEFHSARYGQSDVSTQPIR